MGQSQEPSGEHEHECGDILLNWKLVNVLGFKQGKKDDPDNYRIAGESKSMSELQAWKLYLVLVKDEKLDPRYS
ncbi:hypothetical protein TURU_164327 [Turdus rufiventris]|nr:hypothetical protein TURU_164327 [Turdus rufiventris]